MKKFSTNLLKTVIAFLIVTGLSSSVPVSKSELKKSSFINQESIEKTLSQLKDASKDGKISYKELKDAATTFKGKKLTFKEKVALKLFGKKISKKTIAALNAQSGSGEKSQLIALLLCVFVGSLGIHRFYLGYTWQGIVQLLTLGVCGIWTLIDLIRICTGDLQPKDGSYDKTL